MIDLIAAIVVADPPSLLAWLVFSFAAGMYPLGLMLGSPCSPCCGPCSCCVNGPSEIVVEITSAASGEVNGGGIYNCLSGGVCATQNFSGTLAPASFSGSDCGRCTKADCSQLAGGTFTLTKVLTSFSCNYSYAAGTRACGSPYIDRVSIACERATSPASCATGRYNIEVSWKCLASSGASYILRPGFENVPNPYPFDCSSFSSTDSSTSGQVVFRRAFCPSDCGDSIGGDGTFASSLDDFCGVWQFCDATLTVAQQ